MARYRKIDPRFWRDEKVINLSTEEKAITLYIITAQSNRIGCFNFSPALAAEDLGMSPQMFAERFQNVTRTMKWDYDERFRVLYIPTWWKYNQPENPNNLIGNLKDLDDLPDSPLVSKFMENLEFLNPQFHETFTQTLRERYPKRYPKRMAIQEQKQEQKQKQEQEEEKNSASRSPSSEAREWLDLINRETGRQFRPVDANLRPIQARIREWKKVPAGEVKL